MSEFSELERLANEARRLAHDSDCFTSAFQAWQLAVTQTLCDKFPKRDPIHEEFRRLQFEMPPELAAAARENLKRFGQTASATPDPSDDYFKKTMLKAEEIIRAGMYALGK